MRKGPESSTSAEWDLQQIAAAVAMSVVTGLAFAGPNGGVHSDRKVPMASVTGPNALSNINLVIDACNGVSGTLSVTVTGTTNDSGGNDIVWFTIWDDSVQKFAQQINVPVGQTTTTTVSVSYPGGIGTSAPGIGLELGETQGSSNLTFIDPFFPTPISGCTIGQPSVNIPTLSEWALGSLAAMVGLLGAGLARRRRRA